VGMISKLVGLLFTAAGVIILMMMGTVPDPMMSAIWIFVGMVIITIGFSLINAGRQTRQMKPPPPTVTEIRCDNPDCDFKEIRNFESGDYILKTLDVRCPKCNSAMTIQGVYVVKEEDEGKSSI